VHSPIEVSRAATNSSSHGSESASPCPTRQEENNVVNLEESSGNSEEGGRRGTRMNWTEDENIRLLSAWLNNSVDPIDGNDKKAEYYWKSVAAEFNSNTPPNYRRTVVQCKTHWGGVKKEITKFCGVYSQVRSTWSSGHSDDMIMESAHKWFKSENNEKLFTLEYMWREVKDQPKWRRVLEEEEKKNKRTKISESGAYTSSSNQDTEEDTNRKEKRPEGQKKAKAKLKGKGKGKNIAPSPLGDQPCQDFVLFNEAIKIKAATMEKSAEAIVKSVEAKKEHAKAEKYQTYLKLLDRDTSNFSEAKLRRHEAILEKLANELADG
jgi:hypothetical protein